MAGGEASVDQEVDESIGELFSLPLQDFTGARNDLAKRLTKAGTKQAAATVKALRKPSITAWALNQLVRDRSDEVDALLDSGEKLRRAHAKALEGDASDLRHASRDQQQRVGELTRRAVAILDGS